MLSICGGKWQHCSWPWQKLRPLKIFRFALRRNQFWRFWVSRVITVDTLKIIVSKHFLSLNLQPKTSLVNFKWTVLAAFDDNRKAFDKFTRFAVTKSECSIQFECWLFSVLLWRCTDSTKCIGARASNCIFCKEIVATRDKSFNCWKRMLGSSTRFEEFWTVHIWCSCHNNYGSQLSDMVDDNVSA